MAASSPSLLLSDNFGSSNKIHLTADEVTAALKSKTLLCNASYIQFYIDIFSEFVSQLYHQDT
jgi:hypothetical protein